MEHRITIIRTGLAPALAFILLALGAQTAVAAKLAALPRSDYAVRPACSAPAPGAASCLALSLEPTTAAAQARVHSLATKGNPQTSLAKASECAVNYPSSCLTPDDLRSAYFPDEPPQAPASEPQTIALVDAYNDLSIEADLNVYSTEFGLPPCTTANGCFKKVGENGSEASSSLPFPRSKAELEGFAAGTQRKRVKAEEAEGWALETATDVEVAHAVCQNCHILLVEAAGPDIEIGSELETAEETAVALHATEVSNSWGGQENGIDISAFNHPGTAITAAAGDDGYLNWDQYATSSEPSSPYFEGADYPASSPHVISVGGTHLSLAPDGAWESESSWNSEGAGGSGCSTSLLASTWQRQVGDWAQVGCGERRANADISADADPSTGVNIYDSTTYPQEEEGKKVNSVPHWVPVGGTSVASPIIAAMVALAGGAHGVAYPSQTLYSHLGSPLLHDVSSGGNGECDDDYSACSGSLVSPLDCGAGSWICNATSGYDGPTGVGTPNGIGAFQPSEALGGEDEESQSASGSPEGANAAEESKLPVEPGLTLSGPALGAARISALALTATARASLRRSRLTVARLAFSFTSSRAVSVRVRLAIRGHSGRHVSWRALPASLAFAAVKGLNRRRLHGSRVLAPGTYRLTLAPSGGASRSILIHVP
ncbi:MAG: S53 family peptidase [Solirubrobacteraceae bacterium]